MPVVLRVLIIAAILVAALVPGAAIAMCFVTVALLLVAPVSTNARERVTLSVPRAPYRALLSLRAPPTLG